MILFNIEPQRTLELLKQCDERKHDIFLKTRCSPRDLKILLPWYFKISLERAIKMYEINRREVIMNNIDNFWWAGMKVKFTAPTDEVYIVHSERIDLTIKIQIHNHKSE